MVPGGPALVETVGVEASGLPLTRRGCCASGGDFSVVLFSFDPPLPMLKQDAPFTLGNKENTRAQQRNVRCTIGVYEKRPTSKPSSSRCGMGWRVSILSVAFRT
eukprot:scaffold510_cov155-Amphora_coffeaeformis.AAC.2